MRVPAGECQTEEGVGSINGERNGCGQCAELVQWNRDIALEERTPQRDYYGLKGQDFARPSQQKFLTVFLTFQWSINDIVIVCIKVQLISVVKSNVKSVYHWNECVEIVRRARRPVFPKVGEHVDMVSN